MLFSTNTALAFGNDETWSSGWGMGVAESIITRGPGNQIYVTCEDGAGRDATGISFMLAGKSPSGSKIQLSFDKKDPEDYSIWDGQITSSCRACAATYDDVIAKFKKHSTVHVKFANGLSSVFSLKGASKAIGSCIADFYR